MQQQLAPVSVVVTVAVVVPVVIVVIVVLGVGVAVALRVGKITKPKISNQICGCHQQKAQKQRKNIPPRGAFFFGLEVLGVLSSPRFLFFVLVSVWQNVWRQVSCLVVNFIFPLASTPPHSPVSVCLSKEKVLTALPERPKDNATIACLILRQFVAEIINMREHACFLSSFFDQRFFFYIHLFMSLGKGIVGF